MEEYKPNSHKSREGQTESVPAKKVQKVVTGEVMTRKKSGLQKLAEALISDDASAVPTYILTEIVLPKAKDTVFDALVGGLEMIFYGRSGRRNNSPAKVSYTSYYDSGYRREPPRADTARQPYRYDQIVVSTRGEAEEVLTRMGELIESYGLVSVADLYDLVGITGNYTDNNYGWTDIRTAEPIRVREGYMLRLPKARPLD